MRQLRTRTARRPSAVAPPAVRPNLTLAGLVVGLALCLVLAAPTRTPAAAAADTPVTPTAAGPAHPADPADPNGPIEDLSPYQRQTSCDPVVKPGTAAFVRLLQQTYPGVTAGTVRDCGADGIASEHYEGRAVDVMASLRDPAGAAVGQGLVDWLLAADAAGHRAANARRLGVMYLIWDNRIWGSYSAAGWRPYSTCAQHPEPGYDTACHRNHVHVSLSWAGAMGRTSYWTGKAAAVDYGPCRPADLAWAAPYRGFNPTPCPAHSDPAIVGVPSDVLHFSGATVGSGSRGPVVTAVQRALAVGTDGDFGPQTAAAVTALHIRHGLPAGPAMDPAAWRGLLDDLSRTPAVRADVAPARPAGTAEGTLSFGMAGPAVLALQTALGVHPLSGRFGPVTRAAVIAFQRAHGLQPTGVTDGRFWTALHGG